MKEGIAADEISDGVIEKRIHTDEDALGVLARVRIGQGVQVFEEGPSATKEEQGEVVSKKVSQGVITIVIKMSPIRTFNLSGQLRQTPLKHRIYDTGNEDLAITVGTTTVRMNL